MDRAYSRRQLPHKQEQQAAALKKVGDARKTEADKRSAAAKAAASANSRRSDTTRRSKLRDAARDEKAANSTGQDAAREQSTVAGLGKADGTTIQEAHDLGRAALVLDGLPGADLPQLAHARDVDPRATTLVVPPASAHDAVS